MRLITFLEAVNQDTLSGGAGVLVFIPRTGRILVQIRGEHPDDKDSGKYDLFGGTLEEGETAEECARREAKEEGDLDFDELEEIGAFSSTENGDWDGEPYHVFLSVQEQEFPVKIDHDEVEKAGWVVPDVITDENATNRLVKVLQHEKLKSVLHNNLTEAHLFESKKDQYYQMFSGLTDQLAGLGQKDVGDEVKERINKIIRTMGREDRILWALRIFKKMFLLELKQLSKEDPDWPWTKGAEKALRKLDNIPVHDIPKFVTPNYEQMGYGGKETDLKKLGFLIPSELPRGRGRTKERNEAIKRNQEILAKHFDDPNLFHVHSYGGLDTILDDIGHYVGVGEAHTDVEPNNPVVSYQFADQPFTQVKRELARLTKPLERKYKAGDVAQGEVFMELSPEWRWELLSRTCRKEAKALGHCGGVRDPNIGPNDRLLSLRELRKIEDTERTRSFAHLTFVIDTQTGELSQMRGQANTKPKAQYHPYIVPLLLDNRVTGFKPVAWKPEGNFHLSDLQPAQINQIITAKPNLLNSLEPEGKKAVMMKIGKRAPRRPSPAAAAARQQPQQPQAPYPQMPRAMGEANLTEKMQPVSKDVDYIFNTYYADLFKAIASGHGALELSLGADDKVISSEELPSARAKKAHALNPIKIRLSMRGDKRGNAYNPVEGEMFISPSVEAMTILKNTYGSIESAVDLVPDHQKAQLRNEYNGVKIRTSMAHELSHWMNDTFHNRHIRNLLQKGRVARDTEGYHKVDKIIKKGQPDTYMTDYEIDAQIHQIRELRRRLRGRWNTLSFEQMVGFDNSLSGTYNRIKNMSSTGVELKQWKKMLLKRMAREGLLGKRMTGVAEAVYPYAGYNFPGDWYHGMASSSRAFLRRKGSHPSNIGIWLTNNKNIAGQFAKQAARRMVDDQPILVVAKTMAENPLVFDTYREYLEMWREYGDSEKMRRSLLRKGHDSILIAKSDTDFGGEPRMDLAVFQPSMVKAVEKETLTESDSILDAVLAEPGQNPGIGAEKEKKITPEISILTSPYGSYRFIYRKGGKIVSGLQVVSRDGKHATTANVKTHPDFLRQGLARELLGVARKKFKSVDHSEHLTDLGAKFAQGTG